LDQLVAIRESLLIENLSGLCSGESWRTKMLLVTGKLCFGALVVQPERQDTRATKSAEPARASAKIRQVLGRQQRLNRIDSRRVWSSLGWSLNGLDCKH
jgi:hypothetical protein